MDEYYIGFNDAIYNFTKEAQPVLIQKFLDVVSRPIKKKVNKALVGGLIGGALIGGGTSYLVGKAMAKKRLRAFGRAK